MKIKYSLIFWGSVVLTTVILIILANIKYHAFNTYKNFYFLYFICGTFLWYSIVFLNLNKSIVFSILAFAAISQKIWIYEIIKRDWTGLIWLNYFHIAFVIIYALFIAWLSYMEYHVKNKIKTAIVHLLFYSFIFIVFIKYTTDNLFWAIISPRGYVAECIYYFVPYINNKLNNGVYNDAVENYHIYLGILIFLELLVILIINTGILFMERKKFSKKIIGIILLPIISIPIYTAMLTSNYGLLDWEHWLKTGNIIFSVILYECTYIVYVKTKGVTDTERGRNYFFTK